MLELKEGAVLVADAHYASYRPQLKLLIDKLLSGEIQTTQLLLMGDIFDLLMGPIDRFVDNNRDIINALNQLSQKIEVIYFEGNHDFVVSKTFPDMKVYSLSNQPVAASYKGSKGYLAHGDWGSSWSYRLYCTIIRNKPLLHGLNFVDKIIAHKISKFLENKMHKKQICSDFVTFQEHIERKFEKHKHIKGWFIEGHYHQGSSFFIGDMIYHNLQAMACNKSYFVVQSNKNDVVLTAFTL
jgi:UDP-2,3-diacylglucosamine hydrolase